MAALSKAEYLKRYLSKDDIPKEEKIKKRRKIKSAKDSKLRIIDDDIDLKQHQASRDEDPDEAPIIADVIDERPKHVQQLEQYRENSKWKVLGEDDEDGTSALDYGFIDKSLPKVSSSKRHDSNSDDDISPKRKKFSNDTHNLTTHQNNNNKSSKNNGGNDKTGSQHSNQRLNSDSDNSPVRKHKMNAQKKGSSSKNSLDRSHVRHDSGSDNSPPRKKQTRGYNSKSMKSETKFSDSRNGRQSDSDPSPPRQRNTRHDSESDHSPKRRHKHSSESDQSPTQRRKQASESDQSPPRRRKQASESDQSPPRRRKQASESDQSPPRRRKGERHESDESPKKKKSGSSANPTSTREKRDLEPSTRHSRFNSEPKEDNTKKAKKTLGGAKAGLSSAKDMIEEAKQLREKEDKAFGNIDESMLGRNAVTVVRDKETGKRKNMVEEQAKIAEEEKRKDELTKRYQLWGKGMKQQANRASAIEDQVYEASKPFARYSDDQDLDAMQRNEERDEDPMLNYMRTKRKKEEKSGKTKKKELPKYTGPAPPPNRYNLVPGYRWDGVDRSNGFERKIFAQQANKKAVQDIAYKWSTEDM